LWLAAEPRPVAIPAGRNVRDGRTLVDAALAVTQPAAPAGITIKSISEMLTGMKAKMTLLGWAGGSNAIEVELPAGDGTIQKPKR